MVAYSFNPRFIAPIRQGSKTQTIRAIRKRPAKAGEMLQLFSGMRTAHCVRIIPDVRCIQSCTIRIDFDDAMRITRIETFGMPVRGLDAFARRDGFDDIEDMGAFWEHLNGRIDRFIGHVIEWAPPAVALEVAA